MVDTNNVDSIDNTISVVDDSWTRVLNQVKEDVAIRQNFSKNHHDDNDTNNDTCVNIDSLLATYHPLFGKKWKEQMTTYYQAICLSKERPGNYKSLVIETRAAIRFGLCLLCSFQEEEDENQLRTTKTIQNLAILDNQWHECLLKILSAQYGDSKCRVLAAQLLSNCITSNNQASKILSSSIPLSPSKEVVNNTILMNTMQNLSISNDDNGDGTPHKNDDTSAKNITNPVTWVDILLSCAKSSSGNANNNNNHRDALSAIVATLHNCIVALQKQQDDVDDAQNDDEHDNNRSNSFANKIASNTMLISTLLRQFIDGKNAIPRNTTTTTSNNKEHQHDNGENDDRNDPLDSATEWIYLLLVKLSKFGLLTTMYNSISSTVVVPEHNILLHCMVKEVETYASSSSSSDGENGKISMPIGGELTIDDSTESCVALANLLCELLKEELLSSSNRDPESTTEEAHDDHGDDDVDSILLRHSAVLSLVDIFAILLGFDDNDTMTNNSRSSLRISDLRLLLGLETSLMQDVSKYLGFILDDLTAKTENLKAREIKLSQDQQNLITSFIRFIGNSCYKCRQNQDILRTTLVPPSKSTTTLTSSRKENETEEEPRNAIHILLSCTSYGTSCFTLREWCVIAIRNVLEDNRLNQELVAHLDAQNPIQSSVLDKAGVRLSLDTKGKVSLTPLKEEEEE